ncbi:MULTISPECIES: hypothetical protein [Methylosinus]|uniref:Uncharacterized protein n=1 Tax=Methylosinus trichosporium (strain ATCC 35070 / NCIMB 11131 / UNIQEM 75 / OB3b) TaxID=595536 RepID=A0A2D2D1G3_METT3|nr:MULTISPECIES: hypothetical protein [Methylosinus]ATQ68817.1 hypothetical protein CQW49_13695 [Methylosinus trichosporium OB3b]OBS51500.1 hypothetical protein A8B73_16060 [Methylosinus sp. 3S-1]
MTSAKAKTEATSTRAGVKIDVSDLLGVNQAFLPEYDEALQAELIDANCNKIGTECCCCC